jgi:hypothetical protein
LQLDGLLVNVNGAETEIDTDGGDVVVREGVVGETQKQARLADA